MILERIAQFEGIAGWGISVPAVKTSERRPSIEMTLQGRLRSLSVNCNPTSEINGGYSLRLARLRTERPNSCQ